MANKKISELGALLDPLTPGDLFPIVDVSTGVNNKLRFDQIIKTIAQFSSTPLVVPVLHSLDIVNDLGIAAANLSRPWPRSAGGVLANLDFNMESDSSETFALDDTLTARGFAIGEYST